MTEEEAKKRWCPMGRSGTPDIERYAIGNYCIGSACMMWRTLPPKRLFNGREILAGEGAYPDEAIQKMPQGYCGLAGKP